MKNMLFLALSFFIFVQFNAFADPLYERLKNTFENRTLNGDEKQKELRQNAALFFAEQRDLINRLDINLTSGTICLEQLLYNETEKESFIQKLKQWAMIAEECRQHLSPYHQEVKLDRFIQQFNEDYHSFFASFYEEMLFFIQFIKYPPTNLEEEDINQKSLSLRASIKNIGIMFENTKRYLTIDEPSEDHSIFPLYVYDLRQNPAPLRPVISNSSFLMDDILKTFKETEDLDPKTIQNILRRTANYSFSKIKNHANSFYGVLKAIVEHFNQKSGFEPIYDPISGQIIRTIVKTPEWDLTTLSLKQILDDTKISKDSVLNDLMLFHQCLEDATNLIDVSCAVVPLEANEFDPSPEANQKRANYLSVLQTLCNETKERLFVLSQVLISEETYNLPEPGCFNIFWQVADLLVNIFGSYEKYLGILLSDSSYQNPPLFVRQDKLPTLLGETIRFSKTKSTTAEK